MEKHIVFHKMINHSSSRDGSVFNHLMESSVGMVRFFDHLMESSVGMVRFKRSFEETALKPPSLTLLLWASFKIPKRKRRPAVYSSEIAVCKYSELKIEGHFLPMLNGMLAEKQNGGCPEDSIDACTNVVGNSCNLASESNKPLIHRDNSLEKVNLAFKRGFVVTNYQNSLP